MPHRIFSIKGKNAIVTGGSRGIGAAICNALADAGVNVAVVARKAEGCEKTAAALRAKGVNAVAVCANVGKPDDCRRIVEEAVAALGGVDILVNNAATSLSFGPSAFCSDEAFDKMFAVNVKGPFMLTKMVLPHMEKAGGGSIINIASTAGIVPPPMIGIYGVTKAALMHLTRVFAKELGAYGVRVNTVAPGLVKTEFSRALWDSEEILNQYLGSQPISKLTEPDDIAGAVLFLASPASGMMTGTVLPVDGGELLG
ncbi:MAG: SDR family oxidoreductase [Myxococcota bacterium]|jgi:NAD(P)-dependent dehydrogenase (short-subunit alcohol dehydrogenase family)